MTYDNADRSVDTTDPVGVVTHLDYDADGNVSARKVGTVTTAFTYTDRGELATTTVKDVIDDPIGAPAAKRDVLVESRAYDKAGRLATVIDANGNQRGYRTDYAYFDDDLVATATLKGFHNPDGSTRDVVLENNTYDAARNLRRRQTDGNSRTTDYTFDAAGRLTSEIFDPSGPGYAGLNRRTSYGYDAASRVTVRVLSDAGRSETTGFQYTPTGQVKQTT